MDGMDHIWAMGGGWIIGIVVLIFIFWLGARIMNQSNNRKSHQ